MREIKKDISYFRESYERAELQVDISGLLIEQAAGKVKEALEVIDKAASEHGKSEQVHARRRGTHPNNSPPVIHSFTIS